MLPKRSASRLFRTNAESALKNGAQITDNIVTWVKKDFAAGPFDEPPLKNFRVNPLMAVVQPGKVRPILNVSLPTNSSFNSNMKVFEMEKVTMTSAKEFGKLLVYAGKNALMSKSDLVAAYVQASPMSN